MGCSPSSSKQALHKPGTVTDAGFTLDKFLRASLLPTSGIICPGRSKSGLQVLDKVPSNAICSFIIRDCVIKDERKSFDFKISKAEVVLQGSLLFPAELDVDRWYKATQKHEKARKLAAVKSKIAEKAGDKKEDEEDELPERSEIVIDLQAVLGFPPLTADESDRHLEVKCESLAIDTSRDGSGWLQTGSWLPVQDVLQDLEMQLNAKLDAFVGQSGALKQPTGKVGRMSILSDAPAHEQPDSVQRRHI